LTRTTYETKRMVMKMGREHVSIHCCAAGHVLYEEEGNKDLEECPKCSLPRYVIGSNKVPVKVLRYFPIIPRL
jgi:acetyl-CoA carboxylase beta subunit